MTFFFSTIMTFVFIGGAVIDENWEGGVWAMIEQLRYTYYRMDWVWAGWFGFDPITYQELHQDYWFGHYPFLYLLPVYGTFIHFFFKPQPRMRSWT